MSDERKTGLTIEDREQLPARALADPFRPDEGRLDEQCACLHCGRTFLMREIVWDGIWRCPFAGCDGGGVGCDLFAADSGMGQAIIDGTV